MVVLYVLEKNDSLIALPQELKDSRFDKYSVAGTLDGLLFSDFCVFPADIYIAALGALAYASVGRAELYRGIDLFCRETRVDPAFFKSDQNAINAVLGSERVTGNLHVLRYFGESKAGHIKRSEAYLISETDYVSIKKNRLRVNGIIQRLGPEGIGYFQQAKSGCKGTLRVQSCGRITVHRKLITSSGSKAKIHLLQKKDIEDYFSPRFGN